MNTQLRHGDVLLEQINSIPAEAKKINNNPRLNNPGYPGQRGKLLAEGEASNHGHFIEGDTDVLEKDEDLYLAVKKPSTLKHLLIDTGIWAEEHEDIKVAPGNYKVIRQVEYDPYEKMALRVQD